MQILQEMLPHPTIPTRSLAFVTFQFLAPNRGWFFALADTMTAAAPTGLKGQIAYHATTTLTPATSSAALSSPPALRLSPGRRVDREAPPPRSPGGRTCLVCDHDRPAGRGNHASHHRRFLDLARRNSVFRDAAYADHRRVGDDLPSADEPDGPSVMRAPLRISPPNR